MTLFLTNVKLFSFQAQNLVDNASQYYEESKMNLMSKSNGILMSRINPSIY